MKGSLEAELSVRVLVLLSAGILLWFVPAALAEADYIVRQGRAEARIYLPEKVSYTTILAAQELQTYIRKMTGATLPLQYSPYDEEGLRFTERNAFILAPATIGVYTGGDERDRFEIVRDKWSITIRSESEAGVLFGVYSYLQDLGVRWLSPGPDGEVVPQKQDIPIGSGTASVGPAFTDRTLWYNGDRYWHFKKSDHWTEDLNDWWRWGLRNRLNTMRHAEKRSSRYVSIAPTRVQNQHYIHVAALEGVDIEKQPERFALYRTREPDKRFPSAVQTKDGYRIKTDNICMTNDENIQQSIQHSIAYLREHPELNTAPMSLGDFSGVCECDRCRAANGGIDPSLDPNRVVWTFMNKVVVGVDKAMPGKGIGFYACYGQMTEPPEGLKSAPTVLAVVAHVACNAHPLDDEACIHNAILTDHLRAIQTSGAQIKVRAYTMWYGNVQPLSILDSIKAFHALGARKYSCELMGRDELRNIVQWCMARLLWDSEADPQALLKEYTDTCYGAAGPDVLAILNALDKRVQSDRYIVFNTGFDLLQPELTGRCRELLAHARVTVTGVEAERLALFEKSLEMLFRRADVYRLQARLNMERTPEALQKAKTTFAAFETWLADEDVFDTCSPQLLQAMLGSKGKLETFDFTHAPGKGRGDIAEGGRAARVAALFTNTTAPMQTDDIMLLPDVWKFSLDLDRTGEAKGWMNESFDDSTWLEVSVYDFLSSQGIFTWSPHFWYRTTFNTPNLPEGKRIWMRIGALDDGGTVYLNGQPVYHRRHLRPNDWKTSFECDVTDVIRKDRVNTVAIHGIDHQGAAGLWRGVGIYAR